MYYNYLIIYVYNYNEKGLINVNLEKLKLNYKLYILN